MWSVTTVITMPTSPPVKRQHSQEVPEPPIYPRPRRVRQQSDEGSTTASESDCAIPPPPPPAQAPASANDPDDLYLHFRIKRGEYKRIVKDTIGKHPEMRPIIAGFLDAIAEHTLIETSRGKVCGGDTNTMESNVEGGQKWLREQQDGLKELASIERELASALSRVRLMREDGWK